MPAVTDLPIVEARTPHPRCDDERARMDRALFARRDQGDPRAREALIERFLPLAKSIARRYETSGEPLEDLVQVASLGLVNAIDRYDASRGCAFSSYAVPTIAGELKRYFRDRTWAIRPPRDLQECTLRVEAATRELTARLDRAPTIPELAAETDCSDEQILEALQARRTRATLSLDAPTGLRDDPSEMLHDRLGSSEHGYAHVEARAELEGLLRVVAPRERLALRLRYERDLTQAEIGALLGVSQMQVSRILRAAIEQLSLVATHDHQLFADRCPSRPDRRRANAPTSRDLEKHERRCGTRRPPATAGDT
jgi:RNA polymerase sigma-B factor